MPVTDDKSKKTGGLGDFNFDDNVEMFGIGGQSIDKTSSPPPKATTTKKEGKKEKDEDEDEVVNLEDDNEDDTPAEPNPEDFTFETPTDSQDSKKKTKIEPKKPEKKKIDKDKDKDEDADDDEDKDADEDLKEEDLDKDKDDDDEDDDLYNTLALELKERGVFQNVELPKGKKLSEDEFFELQDEEVNLRVQETFESFFDELDEDGKAFLKHKKAGGTTEEFARVYFTPNLEIKDEFDENNDSERNAIINHYLATVEGLDAEEIADKREWLKEQGKEKDKAIKYHAVLLKAQVKAKKELEEAVKSDEEAVTKSNADFNKALKDTLEKTDAVGIFPITRTDQRELGGYFTKPVVKVGKNRFIPQFQSDLGDILRAKNEKDRKDLILLGKLVKERFQIKDLATKVETKKVKEIKATVDRNKLGIRAKSSGNSQVKELSDFF